MARCLEGRVIIDNRDYNYTCCQESRWDKQAASRDITSLPVLHQWELTSHQLGQTQGSLPVTSRFQACLEIPKDSAQFNAFYFIDAS